MEERVIEYNQPIRFNEKIREDIIWRPEAAVSKPILYQTEEKCFLTFNAVRKGENDNYYGYIERNRFGLTAIVEMRKCICTKFGYPNDEALGGHPLRDKGLIAYGIFKVLNSSWLLTLEKQNKINFPNHSQWFYSYSHFIFTFHDSTFECICDELHITLSEEPYKKILKMILNRL